MVSTEEDEAKSGKDKLPSVSPTLPVTPRLGDMVANHGE